MEKKEPLIYYLTLRLLFLALMITLLIVGKPILLPLAVAVLFSFLLLPISQKLENWGVHRGIAIVISLIIAALFVAALMYFFYSQIQLFINDWPQLSQAITEKIDEVNQFIKEKFNLSEYEQKNWFNERLTTAGESAGEYALGIFSATSSIIATIALLPIFIFFLTYYRDKIKHFVELIAKNEHKAEHVLEIMKKVTTVSQKYLKGIFLDVLILSVLNSTGFLLLGLQHAVLFGVLLAFLNLIPYIGVLIGSILPFAMALLTGDSFTMALGVIGVCVLVQFLDNNFITPNVVGSSVSINPFTAILALTTSALIWGLAGMIIALPFVGMMKVAFDNIESLKPLGFLIGEEHAYSPDTRFSKRIFHNRKKIQKPGNSQKLGK